MSICLFYSPSEVEKKQPLYLFEGHIQMMAVILKVKNLNCGALKLWELKLYMAFRFAPIICRFNILNFEICITDINIPYIIESNDGETQFTIEPVLQNRLLSAL
jgi:hypothetical protein